MPKNTHKYVGDINKISFRSSWERKLFVWLDQNPNILKWASEEHIIPYVSPVDGRMHRYFVDVFVQYKTKMGEIKKALVEVKPYKQTQAPEIKSRQTKAYITEVTTYAVNQAKWKAAKKWCDDHNFEWLILTERELNIK